MAENEVNKMFGLSERDKIRLKEIRNKAGFPTPDFDFNMFGEPNMGFVYAGRSNPVAVEDIRYLVELVERLVVELDALQTAQTAMIAKGLESNK